jgi:predicted RNase H-like HicB family nuclease
MNPKRRHPRRETLQTVEYSYTVLFEPGEDAGFVATVPALPGLVTEGRTMEEARVMVRDAIVGYLECLRKDGQDIPVESNIIAERVAVSFARA